MTAPYNPFQPTLTPQGQSHFGIDVQLRKPSRVLEGIVYAYVQVKIDQPTVYPIVPDGTNIMFFSECRESFGGTQAQILEVPLAIAKGEYFGIWFYPGAVRHIFNVDLSDAKGTVLEAVFLHTPDSSEFRFLHERIYEQSDFASRAFICEHLLSSLLLKRNKVSQFIAYLTHALSLIYHAEGRLPVDVLAAQVGCSTRHLNRVFQLNVGTSVKAFSQTIRMNAFLKRRAFSSLTQSSSAPFSSMFYGLDLGFFDQSHLIKSFKKQGLDALSPFALEFMSGFYNSK